MSTTYCLILQVILVCDAFFVEYSLPFPLSRLSLLPCEVCLSLDQTSVRIMDIIALHADNRPYWWGVYHHLTVYPSSPICCFWCFLIPSSFQFFLLIVVFCGLLCSVFTGIGFYLSCLGLEDILKSPCMSFNSGKISGIIFVIIAYSRVSLFSF